MSPFAGRRTDHRVRRLRRRGGIAREDRIACQAVVRRLASRSLKSELSFAYDGISHVDTNELSGAGRQREAAAGNGFDLIVPKISWSSGGNAGGAGGTGD